MSKRFKNKVAIITGGADGIGKAVAYRLGREGSKLVLLDINPGLLHKTAKEFEAKGITVKGYPVDISNETQIVKPISAVEEEWGRVDILVHAAGIVGPTNTKITEYNTADFDKIYAVNLKGSFLMAKYTLKVMEKSGKGRILLIASMAGKEGNPGMVGYSSYPTGQVHIFRVSHEL